MLDRGLAQAQVRFFQALGDETRLRLLVHLLQGERNVSELVALSGKEQSIISHHLRCLRTCGLVRTRKSGREVFYSLDDDGRIGQLLRLSQDHVSAVLQNVLSCDVLPSEPPNVVLK